MLKPVVPNFRSHLFAYLNDIAEKQVPAKLKPMVVHQIISSGLHVPKMGIDHQVDYPTILTCIYSHQIPCAQP